jgi:aldose 1-epimerase
MTIKMDRFGQTSDGIAVDLYTLTNTQGMEALITNYGAVPGLILKYFSRHGEEGYPGSLRVTVTYNLTDENEQINYEAQADQPTVINLTHHSYFNLAGAGSGDILGHILTILADQFTPVDNRLIPTGELRSVRGTPMDFTQPTGIGARIEQDDEQLILGNGYDHNWVLNKKEGQLTLAARVIESKSGRTIEVYTNQVKGCIAEGHNHYLLDSVKKIIDK